MTCPICNGNSKVTNTYDYIDHVIRYRKCLECGYAFHTVEIDKDIYQRLFERKTGNKDD